MRLQTASGRLGALGEKTLSNFENTVKIFKEIHPQKILLFQFGNFYRAYGRDALIVSYIFGYQLTEVQNMKTCGFPKAALNKVMTKIEENNISYIILNKCDQYNEEHEENFKSKNKYMQMYEKAKKYLSVKNRSEKIYKNLLNNIDKEDVKEKIKRIEEVLYG